MCAFVRAALLAIPGSVCTPRDVVWYRIGTDPILVTAVPLDDGTVRVIASYPSRDQWPYPEVANAIGVGFRWRPCSLRGTGPVLGDKRIEIVCLPSELNATTLSPLRGPLGTRTITPDAMRKRMEAIRAIPFTAKGRKQAKPNPWVGYVKVRCASFELTGCPGPSKRRKPGSATARCPRCRKSPCVPIQT